MPETAQEALARDIILAAEHQEAVRKVFRRERDRLAAKPDADPVREAEWAAAIAALWVVAAEQVYPSTVIDINPSVTPGPAPDFSGFIQNAVEGIVRTSRRRIEALRLTKPLNLSRQLRKLYQVEFIKKRAPRIALDQALRQTASFEAAAAKKVEETTGVPSEKVWHNQGDSKVRSSHLSVSTVLRADPFLVGGTELEYPRDPAGTGRETFGCRCWAEYREATEETLEAIPLGTAESEQVEWKPLMSEAEANAYTSGSEITGTQYHGTDAGSISGITGTGFDPSSARQGHWFGEGTYFTNEAGATRWAKVGAAPLGKGGPALVKTKVNVRNPFIVEDLPAMPNVINKHITASRPNPLGIVIDDDRISPVIGKWLDDNPVMADVMNTVNTRTDFGIGDKTIGARFTATLKEKGFDGAIIRASDPSSPMGQILVGGEEVLVFDTKQIATFATELIEG